MSIPNRPRVVVTGAGGGLGRAFCTEFARRPGARLIVSDVRADAAEETAEIVRRAGAEAHAMACDVSQAKEVEALAVAADERYGGADVIVNNAGVASAGEMGEVPLEDWSWIMGINLWGVIYGCHSFVPRLRRQRQGHVINVASAAGLLAAPGMGPYNVTKAGVVALSETLCAELADHGVGVTVLCPTFFQTDIVRSGRLLDPRAAKQAEKLMSRSKIDAAGVARVALACADAGQLYALPQADGRWAWRLKRLAPNQYYTNISRVIQRAVLGRKPAPGSR